jgi:polyphosphate kinase
MYLGSADLMPRNIDRRVEVLFPIEDPLLRQELVENVLQVYLRDTVKGRWLQPDGSYVRAGQPAADGEAPFNSQEWFVNGRVTLQHQLDVRAG